MSQRTGIVLNVQENGGIELVRGLARNGFNILCHSASFEHPSTRIGFENANPGMLASPLTDVIDFVNDALSRYGNVDVAIANIVTNPWSGPFEALTDEDVRSVLKSYTIEPFLLARAVIPSMKARREGRIIFVTTAETSSQRPNLVIDSAARSATNAMVVGLAAELGRFGISINAIARICSPHRHFLTGVDTIQASEGHGGNRAKLDALSELAQLVELLASGQADLVTGQLFSFAESVRPQR